MADAPSVKEQSVVVYSAVAVASLVLLLLTGVTAGLATGFLGLDPTHLEVLRRSGSEAQRQIAQRLQGLLSRHNLVLFSVVLLHAIADEALPLVLERAFNEYIAVALSVPLVLLFGEVLPAAVFSSWSGGDGSTVLTARLAPLMWACVAVAGVVTLPLSWAVERCVCCKACGRSSGAAGARGSGHHSGHAHGLRAYRRHELAAFLQIHAGAGEGADDEQHSLADWRRASSWSGRGSDGRASADEGERSSAGSLGGRASDFRAPLLAGYSSPLASLPPPPSASASTTAASSTPLPGAGSAVASPGLAARLRAPLGGSHASGLELLQVQARAPDTPGQSALQTVVVDAVYSQQDATPPFRTHGLVSTAAPAPPPPSTAQGLPDQQAASSLVALAPPGASSAPSPARRSDGPDPTPSDSVVANAASVGILSASGATTEESNSAQVTGTEGSGASASSSQNEGAAGGSLVGHGMEAGARRAAASDVTASPERAFPAQQQQQQQQGGAAHLSHVETRANLLSRISSPALQFWRSAAPWRRVTPRMTHPLPGGPDADLRAPQFAEGGESGSQSERASSDDGGGAGEGSGDIPEAVARAPPGVQRPVAEHVPAGGGATPALPAASGTAPAAAAASAAGGGRAVPVRARSLDAPQGSGSASDSTVQASPRYPSTSASGDAAPDRHHHVGGHPRHHYPHHHRSHGGAHGGSHPHEERGGSLTRSELSLLEGTLGLMSRSVASRMVPLDRVFALAETAPVDAALLSRVADTAHSRLPVLAGDGSDRHAIVGLLLVKALLRLPEILLQQRMRTASEAEAEAGPDGAVAAPPAAQQQLLVGDLPLLPPCALHPRTTMLDALRTFQSEHCHMAVVTQHVDAARMALSRGADDTGGETLTMRRLPPGLQILGVITLEDCILAVLNDDYHARPPHPPPLLPGPAAAAAVAGAAAAPPHAAALEGGAEAAEHGAAHGGTGPRHHGHVVLHPHLHRSGGAPSRGGHGAAAAAPGRAGERVGSVMSDANDMQRVARIMAHRQHRHLQPL